MNEDEPVSLHAVIQGRVQGVGFRAFVIDRANALGVKGWVRNRWDGSVEVVAEGEIAILEELLYALHQGPRMSNVTTVAVDWGKATGEFKYFYSRSTG
jgi:acylphosphatase